LCQDCSMYVLLRIAVSAAALAVATAVVPGIKLGPGSPLEKVLTLVAVALIFGVVNAVLKPIVKTVGCIFYVLTLGLLALVVNGLLLWLTSAVAGALSLPFHITGFGPAFLGAIVVGIVSWLLSVLVKDEKR
jgi:putative membrane protein